VLCVCVCSWSAIISFSFPVVCGSGSSSRRTGLLSPFGSFSLEREREATLKLASSHHRLPFSPFLPRGAQCRFIAADFYFILIKQSLSCHAFCAKRVWFQRMSVCVWERDIKRERL
jgi:hypothetical protein